MSILDVLDDMSTIGNVRTDFVDSCREVNVFPKLELLGISFEVGAVLGRKEEVWRLWGVAKIREGGKLSGRDELEHNQCQRSAFLTSLKVFFAKMRSRKQHTSASS